MDYLKLESGRYVIYNDSIHEGSGADMNPLLSRGLVRTLFTNLLATSEGLGLDSGRRPRWRDICARLSAFPLQRRGGKTVFRYGEKGTVWADGNTLGIHHIFPAGAIGAFLASAELKGGLVRGVRLHNEKGRACYRAIEFLETHARGAPWFLKVSFHGPHAPLNAPKRWSYGPIRPPDDRRSAARSGRRPGSGHSIPPGLAAARAAHCRPDR